MEIVTAIEREQMGALLREGKRIDGRGFDDVRPIKIDTDIISKAEGSAEAWLGKSRILSGVKVATGKPFPDTPDEGVIITSAELSPIASPTFELGPPGEQSIELARVVDRGIRHSDFIQRKTLCIAPGDQVYLLMVDLYVLADHGNLIDTGTLAAVSSLMNTKVPKVEITEEGEAKVLEDFNPLEMGKPPLSVTLAKIENSIIVDPTREEERVMETRLTISIDADETVTSMQKYGSTPLARQEISDCVERASKIVKKMRSMLPKR
jgi:exosome complex component RRP42